MGKHARAPGIFIDEALHWRQGIVSFNFHVTGGSSEFDVHLATAAANDNLLVCNETYVIWRVRGREHASFDEDGAKLFKKAREFLAIPHVGG